jgi:hypothetical protein
LSNVTVEGELAPARVLLWNDDNNDDKLNAGEEITVAEDSAISIEVSGKGSFKTGDLWIYRQVLLSAIVFAVVHCRPLASCNFPG